MHSETSLKLSGEVNTFLILKREVFIFYNLLDQTRKEKISSALKINGFDADSPPGIFKIKRFLSVDGKKVDMAKIISKILNHDLLHEQFQYSVRPLGEEVNFDNIRKHSLSFVNHIVDYKDRVIEKLILYETHKVAVDEIERTLDLFRNLDENKGYYKRKIGGTLSFLPRNQPLYALSCFALALSYMTEKTYVYVPASMQHIFPFLEEILEIKKFFPNVVIEYKRSDLIDKCSQYIYNADTGYWYPVVDAIVFTGTPVVAKKVRSCFDKRILFIGNGAGHNPVIVTESSDLNKAVEAVMELQLYNSGQDCASPSSVLVHESIHDIFIQLILKKLKHIKVGSCVDKNVVVGPVTKIEDLDKIQKILTHNYEWIHPQTPGVINISNRIVNPVIISKPLEYGGNYIEQLSPIFFIQKYDTDNDLMLYFDNQLYIQNAMYVTVYGKSKYVDSLVNYQLPKNKILHTKSTILINRHLHEKGVERGTQEYGGYGRSASWIEVGDTVIPKPTLPQREIYEYIVLPYLKLEEKNIQIEEIYSLNQEMLG